MPAAGVEPNDKTLAELKQLGFVKRIARKGGGTLRSNFRNGIFTQQSTCFGLCSSGKATGLPIQP